MAVARRRTSPITLVLAALLAFGFIIFLFSPSSSTPSSSSSSTPYASSADASSQLRQEDAAENPLSPPTKPFRKSQPVRNDGRRAPPPVVHYNLNQLTSTSGSATNGERVLILTPLSRFYQGYWDNVVGLSYPHELISIGFIVPPTKEGNAAVAALEKAIGKTQSGPIDARFASISILRQDFDPPLTSQNEKERHKLENQKSRRESMSRARNSLVFTTLGPSTSWVLWLDADIVETPPTLIEDLTSHDQPVVVPNCYQRYYNNDKKKVDVRPYDYNSWVDSEMAQALAAEMMPDEIILEGYNEMATYRTLMAHLADVKNPDPRRLMPLDGVGGTALMVKADVHRDGAMFPPFPFYHLVETEGFAKMAKRLGYSLFGLPDYLVYHYNEKDSFAPAYVHQDGVIKTDNKYRKSENAYPPRDGVLQCIEQRAVRFQKIENLLIEQISLQRYHENGFFSYHYDNFASPPNRMNRRSTFNVFLQGNCTGGGTHFPQIPRPKHPNWCQYIDCDAAEQGIVFKPKAGAAVFWVDTKEDGTGYSETLHAGMPVKSGTKVGMNIWSWVDKRQKQSEKQVLLPQQ